MYTYIIKQALKKFFLIGVQLPRSLKGQCRWNFLTPLGHNYEHANNKNVICNVCYLHVHGHRLLWWYFLNVMNMFVKKKQFSKTTWVWIFPETIRDQTTGSRTWVMFTRKRQDMLSSCLANHVTPATRVTETKNCLYRSCHTPLFGALVGFPCVGWDLGPSALEINSLLALALPWWTCSLSRSVRRYGLGA